MKQLRNKLFVFAGFSFFAKYSSNRTDKKINVRTRRTKEPHDVLRTSDVNSLVFFRYWNVNVRMFFGPVSIAAPPSGTPKWIPRGNQTASLSTPNPPIIHDFTNSRVDFGIPHPHDVVSSISRRSRHFRDSMKIRRRRKALSFAIRLTGTWGSFVTTRKDRQR